MATPLKSSPFTKGSVQILYVHGLDTGIKAPYLKKIGENWSRDPLSSFSSLIGLTMEWSGLSH